ncbi:acyltransferase family protein [Bacillus sp. S10(2024)]|uniref:acyltransferase family protein n=1 Tax=Bacillus sp. S10(2024) TaxID=3162886 RepID=UPI003D21CF96
MIKRYKELDSLRGIAALMVLLAHFLTVFPMFGQRIISSNYSNYIKILWDGHAAVVMFFVLSGFVLSLPFYQHKEFNYSKYLIKRLCRIYIPYFLILVMAIIFTSILNSKIDTIPELTGWATSWGSELSFKNVIQHILFLGEYNSDTFIMVIWSLVHEMRISIVFPFIIFLLLKVDWKISIGGAMILSAIGYLLMMNIPSEFHAPVSTNYFVTLHYIAMFIIGALLAKNREYLISKIMDSKVKYLLLPFGILFFNYPRIPFMPLSKLVGEMDYSLYLIVIDWYISFGAALIILSALSLKRFSKLLVMKPIYFMGEISYSLYLVHPIVLLTTIHVLYGKISIHFTLLVSFVITIVASILCHKFIEIPSIKIGRKLAAANNRIAFPWRKKVS